MEYTTLGATGMRVSRFCLGTVPIGSQADEAASRAVMDRAFAAGVNFIDTADVYNEGRAEEYVGGWLRDKRAQAVLATKVRGRTGPGVNDIGLSRKHIMDAVEASLHRLQTDYIDLYQVHSVDPDTPIEETLRALDDLVHQGKVRYIGCSNFAAWQLCRALWVSDRRNLVRFESVQPRYNLLDRTVEAELLPLCVAERVGVIVYNPIGGGFLTGKHQRGRPPVAGSRFDLRQDIYVPRYWRDENFNALERLLAIARESGRTPAQLALAWVLGNATITSAIVGARTVDQLDEDLAVLERPLTEAERRACEEAAAGASVGRAEGPP